MTNTNLPAISAELYTVREFTQAPKPLSESLKKIRNIGYRAVEIAGVNNVSTQDLKSIIKNEGLMISGCHYKFEALQTNLSEIIEQCQILEVKNLFISMMPETMAAKGKPGFETFINEVKKICATLNKSGLTLGHHNHNYEFARFSGQTGLDMIFQETVNSKLDFEIDTYWIQMGGQNPVDWIKKASGRMHAVHFKDFAVDMWTPIFAEVGQGNLNWVEIIKACKSIGVDWYVVEQDICRSDPFECLMTSYEYLNSFGLN